MIVDELGYLSLDQQTSNLFYQVISTRHSQKRSTIITTNTPFSDWGNILLIRTIATSIADRFGGEFRNLLAGRGRPAQVHESESAGHVVAGRLLASAALCDNPPRRSPSE